jgi:hypothetical protein
MILTITQDKRIPFKKAKLEDLENRGYKEELEEFDPLLNAKKTKPSDMLNNNIACIEQFRALISKADRRAMIDVIILDALRTAHETLNAKKREVFVAFNDRYGVRFPKKTMPLLESLTMRLLTGLDNFVPHTLLFCLFWKQKKHLSSKKIIRSFLPKCLLFLKKMRRT